MWRSRASSPGDSTSTSTTTRSDGASTTRSTNSSCSTRPQSPPTSFIRAPGRVTLKTRVLAVLVSHSRTTWPARKETRRSGAGDQQQLIAESAHGSVASLGRAEGGDLAILDENVVQSQDQVAVGRRPVVGVGGDDKDVAVQAEFLGVILPDVRVIPVRPGSGNRRR